MPEYHKYVFDTSARQFVGKFEEMYRAEDADEFDSWHQENLTHISKRIALALLGVLNFDRVIDFGCGKGNFTQLLRKLNNSVVGVDISDQALKKAATRFPEITWKQGRVEDAREIASDMGWQHTDLVVLMEVLSYVENWKEILRDLAGITKWVFVSLYIPENPIGFIKSADDLLSVTRQYFEPLDEFVSPNHQCLYWLGKSRELNSQGEK